MVVYTNYTKGYVVEYDTPCFRSWLLIPAQTLWPDWLLGVFYVAAILYLFLGIAIVADMFMMSIEMITSKRRVIYTYDVKKKERVQREVFVWNETIANLTLMALGSSAPEILISVFETLATLRETTPADSLGLFTIVGSASYNLLVITAICVMAVPSHTSKSINEFGVFIITSLWSIFAYVWLLVVVQWSSPNTVEVWEAVVTLLFFPVFVFSAWIQDKGCWIHTCKQRKKQRNISNNNNNTTVLRNNDLTVVRNIQLTNPSHKPVSHLVDVENTRAHLHQRNIPSEPVVIDSSDPSLKRLVENRSKVRNIVSYMKSESSDHLKAEDLACGLRKHFDGNKAFARARFRHAVVLNITGKKNNLIEQPTMMEKQIHKAMSSDIELSDIREIHSGSFCFSSASYSVSTKAKFLNIDVLLNRRTNRSISHVGFSHVVEVLQKKTRLEQQRSRHGNVQTTSRATVSPMNSLPDVNIAESDIKSPNNKEEEENTDVSIIRNGNSSPTAADSLSGELPRDKNTECYFDYLQHAMLVRYEMRDGRAKADKHYKSSSGALIFDQHEYQKTISIPIMENHAAKHQTNMVDEAANNDFYVVLKDPCHDTILGDPSITHITFIDDNQAGEFIFQEPAYHVQYTLFGVSIVTAKVVRIHGSDGKVVVHYRTINGTAIGGDSDDLIARTCDFERVESGMLVFGAGETSKNVMIRVNPESEKTRSFIINLYDVSCSSAKIGQRCAAIVSLTSEVDEIVDQVTSLVNKDQPRASTRQQFKQQFYDAMSLDEESSPREMCLHFLCFFWKVLFAAIPPRSVWGGWAAFLTSLAMLGLLSALVEQFAKLLGCVIGLHVSVTGITLVALGTSMPDTFASKTAALQDDSADAAIGNITGSNSVNVFLGLGLPWVIKSIYLASQHSSMVVKGDNILFSVLVFLGCGMVTLMLVVVRRIFCGGELGGNAFAKYVSGFVMIVFWFVFVLFSSLQAYQVIDVSGII